MVYKKLMLSIFKAINSQKMRIKTLRRRILLTYFLLIHRVGNNNLLSIRLIKKTRSIKEVLGTIVNKDKIEAKTPLYQLFFLQKKNHYASKYPKKESKN